MLRLEHLVVAVVVELVVQLELGRMDKVDEERRVVLEGCKVDSDSVACLALVVDSQESGDKASIPFVVAH